MTLQAMISGLGGTTRRMRSLPMPIIVAAHGAAIAGGCAILGAADLSVLGDRTMAGYPVHRLGVSPAVTLPTLMQAIGEGPRADPGTRWTTLYRSRGPSTWTGHPISWRRSMSRPKDGDSASTSSSTDPRPSVQPSQWLGALDGSGDETRWSGPIHGSEPLAGGAEAVERLEAFWAKRRDG